MTVIHIVIVKLKPGITEAQASSMCEAILNLKNTIPEILRTSAGKNFTDRGKGFEWGWVSEFAGREELNIYSKHPDHVNFVNTWKDIREDILAFDYEY